MNILTRIKSMFRREPEAPPAGPVLRCRPNGMAWIKGLDDSFGVGQLNNRAVKTLHFTASGKWLIEPHQFFIATDTFIWDGVVNLKGDAVGISAVADNCLEPWKEDGISDSEVSALYAPSPLKESA